MAQPEDGQLAGGSEAAAAPALLVLPWMRVPIAIEPGSGVALTDIHGLDARLLDVLSQSECASGLRSHGGLIACDAGMRGANAGPCNSAASSGRTVPEPPGASWMPNFNPRTTAEHGFLELFPVQAAVWRELAGGHSSAHDMCIAAPTGSGKTLAYALPVLHMLAQR